ncbi:siderophore-interacting protein [Actinomadura hibisca]|uniref:siderophore-interacting protein n=1 Tax=Actinomadura hibisca TaxID=68565 RepID=UPI0008372226|nr:siderophore-interacting protein [Actinomadura hibisca]
MAGEAEYAAIELHVLRAARVGPSTMRVTFGGEKVDDFTSGGRDQRFKLFLPHPHQEAPVVPVDAGEDWFTAWRMQDPAERAVMRTYTVAAQRPGELDVDFVLHGDGAHAGPAAAWAASAGEGDRVLVLGPLSPDNSAIDFRPPEGTDHYLVAADETALPAAAGILAHLPAGTRVQVWISVPEAGDRRELPTAADAEVTWLVRGDGEDIVRAVREADVPAGGTPYAWIAGESAMVKALRRNLVNDRGVDRKAVCFTGYWRRGATEEDLLAEVIAGGTPHLDED